MDHGQRASDQTGWDSVGAALRAASACRKSPPAAAFSARCLRNVCAQGPGKAGRYELTLEGRRALQTSRKGFVSDLGRPTGRLFFAWVEKEAKNAPKPCKKRKSPSDDPPSIFSKGTANEKNRQNHTETVQKERRNVMPRMSRKRWEEWDFFLNRRDRITCNDLCRNCRHGCKRASGRRSWPAGSTGARGAKHGGNAHHGHAPEQGPHNCPMPERPNGLCQKPRQERTMSLLFL